MGADSPDHARGQVFFHALQGARRDAAQMMRPELPAMTPVVDPFPLAFQVFTRRDGRRRSHYRDRITPSAHPDCVCVEVRQVCVPNPVRRLPGYCPTGMIPLLLKLRWQCLLSVRECQARGCGRQACSGKARPGTGR